MFIVNTGIVVIIPKCLFTQLDDNHIVYGLTNTAGYERKKAYSLLVSTKVNKETKRKHPFCMITSKGKVKCEVHIEAE